MKLYSIKLRLNGELLNEVRKVDITPAEVMVLRQIHGPDSIADIVLTGEKQINHQEERERLFQAYVGGENFGGHDSLRARILTELFGPVSNPLPNELPASENIADAPAKPVRKVVKAGPAEQVAAAMA